MQQLRENGTRSNAMGKGRSDARHVVISSGCRSLQFVPGFASSPSYSTSSFGFSKELKPPSAVPAQGPFSGLVICVTGLSKEARKQVEDATENMGGRYSPDLHPQCTHLVVQSSGGRKLEHALKHGIRRGLYVVSLAWFINSAKLNERLDESEFGIPNNMVVRGVPREQVTGEIACLPELPEEVHSSPCSKSNALLRDFIFYLDPAFSAELQAKVIAAATKEGATFSNSCHTGSGVTHVVCDRSSFVAYIGTVCNLVTPLWLLKSVKENSLQRMVQLSADLSRNMALLADASKGGDHAQEPTGTECKPLALCGPRDTSGLQLERQEEVKIAKASVRRRRGPGKQPCRALPRPITPATLLDCVCWAITDAPSAAKVYVDKSPGSVLDVPNATPFFDTFDAAASEVEHFTRPFKECERHEAVYSGVFLTVLFPVDRFLEMGPSARTYFSEKGFTRLQILESIYAFYQENLSEEECKVAIHTDSRHADRLRALYASRESIEQGYAGMKRYELLGGRRSFEGLNRINHENTGQVYELCLGC